MATKLFVGSLSWNVNDAQLKDLFAGVGEVVSATVVTDRGSGQSRGFGFVEMSEEDAKKAVKELNNKELDGRNIIVNEAKPREDRPNHSFGGGPKRKQGGRRY